MKTFFCVWVVGVLCVGGVSAEEKAGPDRWTEYVGKAGASGWRAHVIQPDPHDDGPDGINFHDWDGDGDLDVFVNYEEGGYSRLYFNPGKETVRGLWTDFIEFEKHGQCEDSGIGDLDGDGDIDYVANGGHVYFNPGKKTLRDADAWVKMTLFKNEARNPLVSDVDGDGLKDLIVGASAWYKQPVKGKHEAANWKRYELGVAQWPMSTIIHDIDGDGDRDILVQERRKQGLFYYVNPGKEKVGQPWPVEVIDPLIEEGMFMAIGDVNGDGRVDVVKAAHKKVCIYIRTTDKGAPVYKRVAVGQPVQPKEVRGTPKPKGIAIMEMDGDLSTPEIVIVPKFGQLWVLSFSGDGMKAADWTNTLVDMPGSETRKKMDNAYLADIDGDGDVDIATTEENGGWGVVWFENPGK